MKITCLAENTARDKRLFAEHGLSLFIETEEHKILFDMGQTDVFAKNAEKLGVDLESVDIAVLSHGHYDHGGGLAAFFEINKTAPVYISRYAFEPHYNALGKYIGLDIALAAKDRLYFICDELSLDHGLTLYSCNGYERRFSLGDWGMTCMRNGEVTTDDFRHEQYLLIEEKGKKALISGCSHKGVIDIVNWFEPDYLVGGFHFSKLPLNGKLEQYATALNSFCTEYYTCHCTGVEQFEFLKKYMDRLDYISTGDSIVL